MSTIDKSIKTINDGMDSRGNAYPIKIMDGMFLSMMDFKYCLSYKDNRFYNGRTKKFNLSLEQVKRIMIRKINNTNPFRNNKTT